MSKKIKILTVSLIILVSPSVLNAREFLNTVLHLNFGGMYSVTSVGDLIKEEEDYIKTASTDNYDVSHYETALSITLDIVPMNPILLGMESNAIKFGMRAKYGFHFIQQRISATQEYSDELARYDAWMLGPVVHFAPVINPSDIDNEYTATSGFTFFLLYGRLNGNLSAYPGLRDAKVSVPTYETSLKGYKLEGGFGAEIALCSLNFGVNIYYSYTSFRLGREVYVGAGKDMHLKEVCLELYMGIPIESFIKPFIPRF